MVLASYSDLRCPCTPGDLILLLQIPTCPPLIGRCSPKAEQHCKTGNCITNNSK